MAEIPGYDTGDIHIQIVYIGQEQRAWHRYGSHMGGAGGAAGNSWRQLGAVAAGNR
jgi:hypothetical protein